MEQHQAMIDTLIMNDLGAMNKASVREIMLQHEKTFKEQVQDLHKLYGKQKLLMAERSQSRGHDSFIIMPPQSPCNSNAAAKEMNTGQHTKYLQQAMANGNGMLQGAALIQTPGSPPKVISGRTATVEETLKSVTGTSRKRKIDLEQPPEDDSEDEIEKCSNSRKTTASFHVGDFGGPSMVCSGFRAVSQQPLVPSFQASSSTPTMMSFSNGGSSGRELRMSQGNSWIRSSPCLPPTLMTSEQTFAGLGGENLCFPNSGSSDDNIMLLPQVDSVGRASQETEWQAHRIFQSPQTNIVDMSVKFAAQQERNFSPHHAPSQQSCSMSQPPPPHGNQRHINRKSLWVEPVSFTMGKGGLERHSPGLSCGDQKDTTIALPERLVDLSNWFLNESCLQGASLTNTIPLGRCESGTLMEGGHHMAGALAPAFNKGLPQERDASLWSSKNSVHQLPQLQQQPFPQQQIGPIASQALWMQSSSVAQNNMCHQQQPVYGLHAPDTVQMKYQSDLLQRSKEDAAGSWNMIGFGHYYTSMHSTSQTPSFKEPPKLVLKNDAIGMEQKPSLPEEGSEKAKSLQKKPSTSLEIDSLQKVSKFCEIERKAQKEVGQDVMVKEKVIADKNVFPVEKMQGSITEVKEHSSINGLPTDSTFLAAAPSSYALSFSQGWSAAIPLPNVVELNHGALACTSGSEIGSDLNVVESQNESKVLGYCLQSDANHCNVESEKRIEQMIKNFKTSGAASEKEVLDQMNSVTKNVQAQPEGVVLAKGEIVMELDVKTVEERKDSLTKLSSETCLTDGVISCLSGSFDAMQQSVGSKFGKEDVANMKVQHRGLSLEDAGSLPEQCANAEVRQESSSESKGSLNADSSHPTDQQLVQEVSVQSKNTGKHSVSRQARRSLKDGDVSRRVSGRLSRVCKYESGSPLFHKDCASAASPTTFMSDKKSEAVASVLKGDPQQDSDSDNLAASILLSFAPKLDLSNKEKQPKDTASEISTINGNINASDQGRKLSWSSEDQTCSHLERWNSASSRGQRKQNSGSIQRVDGTDDHDHSNVTVTDRYRSDGTNSPELGTCEGDFNTKRFPIKLPSVTGSTLNDDSIAISRSKCLSKLNRASISLNRVDSMKNFRTNIEAVHTPTGRRSSRGPLLGARGSLESNSLLRHGSQHRVESSSSPHDKDPATMEEDSSKLNKNLKKKAWGELDKTRSHPCKQFFQTANRESQK